MKENRHIERLVGNRLLNLDERGIVLLTGARQTGKTTLIREKYPEMAYYNLDSYEYREQLTSISSFQWSKEVGTAIFDEIQKEPSLLEKIKFSFDNQSVNFSVISGSSQIMLLSKVRESLAGRTFIYELYPFMLCELAFEPEEGLPLIGAVLSTSDIDGVMSGKRQLLIGEKSEILREVEKNLILWGGMPPLLHLPEESRKREWLKSYSIAYLERDLSDLARLTDLKPFRKFQQLAALRTANLLSYSEIARDAGIAVETCRRYIEYLKISYQVFLLSPYYKNLTSQIIKTPKIFWFDNGIQREMSNEGHTIINGSHFENYVGAELYKYINTMNLPARLSFYRTRSGMEIDFCIETENGLIAIEVKNRDTVDEKDFSAIRKLLKSDTTNRTGGIVVYRGNKIIQWGDKLWAVPSSRLFTNF